MTKGHWIFAVALTTLCIQATGDVAALEKKMEMFERQLKSHDKTLKSYGARLWELETKPSLCSK